MTSTSTSTDYLPSSVTLPSTQPALAQPASGSPPLAPGRRRFPLVFVAVLLFVASNVAGFFYLSNRSSAPTKTASDRLLEALGCQSAVHLYQSYLNIGLMSDAVAHKNCTPEEGSNMLNTVAGLMDVVDKQLEGLNKTDFRAEDKEGVQRIRAIASMMRVQVASLQAYWLTGDSQHADRYQKTREQAWGEISKILGL